MFESMTVRKRIFLTNAFMILATLAIIGAINIGVIKIYWETIEHNWQEALAVATTSSSVEHLVKGWMMHQKSFYLLMAADMVICILVWILVSQLFTRWLTRKIMRPLDELGQGAKRIRENDLSKRINYRGDAEFEEICDAFNAMQVHLREEQETNRKYEKARTEMIAGISHDLRTPLTAIRGSIKGLLDGVVQDEERKKKFLETAYRRTGDMDVLLNQLFYLSKLETGNMPLHQKEMDLSGWLTEYMKGKEQALESDGMDFRKSIPEMPVEAFLDPEALQRILDNLIENSRKYSEASPLQIDVSLRQQGDQIEIILADNGKGVPEEKLPRIFDEFFRGDESRNRREGSGLGLYIVRNLVESMNGNVWAENNSGLAVHLEFSTKEGCNGRE